MLFANGMGIGLIVPGTGVRDQASIERQGVKLIPYVSDVINGPVEMEFHNAAHRFAEAYNRRLLQQ